MQLHDGADLREGKDKAESKERGRWKGKMTKYGVIMYFYTTGCLHVRLLTDTLKGPHKEVPWAASSPLDVE
jgi:hypothetical protein